MTEENKKSIEKIEKWLRRTSSLISEKVYKQVSEEEKKIRNVQEMFEDIPIKDIESQSITIYGTAILDVIEVLNLIDKQQKEIEEFRGIKNGTTIIYKCKAKYVREDKINKYYISKNKVREKIREVSNGTYDAKTILEQLLEE